MGEFLAATYARSLSEGARDRFAAIALRARDPQSAINAFERQRRRVR